MSFFFNPHPKSAQKRYNQGNPSSNSLFSMTTKVAKNCPFCPNTIESEIHFLFVCPLYAHFRNQYLRNLPQIDVISKLQWLMSSKSSDVILSLAKYLTWSFKERAHELQPEDVSCDPT